VFAVPAVPAADTVVPPAPPPPIPHVPCVVNSDRQPPPQPAYVTADPEIEFEVPAPPFPEAPPNEPSCPTALDHHPQPVPLRPVFDAPPAKPCDAVPPAAVFDEYPVAHHPDPPFPPFVAGPAKYAAAPYHPPFAVIDENTELFPTVPFVCDAHPEPPVPTVTVYACGVTVKEALYWYHPEPPPQPHPTTPELYHPQPQPQPHITNAFTVAIFYT